MAGWGGGLDPSKDNVVLKTWLLKQDRNGSQSKSHFTNYSTLGKLPNFGMHHI